MKSKSGIEIIFATFCFSLATQAASVVGAINFSSSGSGGITLQDSFGNDTTNLALATGIKTWLLPKVDSSSGSFVSVPDGQAVSFSEPWVFDPSTSMNPLWTISGFGNFTFTLSSSSIVLRNSNFLLVTGTGTLTGTNYDPTPGTWDFSTQGVATENKFSWSSSTSAVPEIGTPALLNGMLLLICFIRRRI